MRNWKVTKNENGLFTVEHKSSVTGRWMIMSEWKTKESATIDMICWDK